MGICFDGAGPCPRCGRSGGTACENGFTCFCGYTDYENDGRGPYCHNCDKDVADCHCPAHECDNCGHRQWRLHGLWCHGEPYGQVVWMCDTCKALPEASA